MTKARAGCLVALGVWVISFLALSGIGRPEGFRYCIGASQVFESAEGLVVFVAMDLVTYRPGPIQSPRVVRRPVRLYRIDVSRDGNVRRQILKYPAGESYHLSFFPILKLPDGLYLLEGPSKGHPSDQLHRIREQSIEPLSAEETGSVLGSFGYAGGGSHETEQVTERNGWRLLDRSRNVPIHLSDDVLSQRYKLRLRLTADDAADSMIAESFGEGERWVVTLLTVKTQRWQSYHRPPDPG